MLEADAEIDRRDFPVTVSLRVAPGERLALFGPSGSGKTTTLEMIAGLAVPRRGRITLGGRLLTQTWAPRHAVPPWRRRVGLLRQDPGLFPHLTVRQNLGYGTAGRPDRAGLARIAARLEIDGLLEEYPARLSGGQAHRVALGRLLLARCDALLLDEPYTGLDAGRQRALTDLVRSVAAERRVPAILVAHELTQAQAFADRLAVLDRGRVLQDGSPSEVVAHPVSRRVAALVGYQGFVPVPEDPTAGDSVAGDSVAGGPVAGGSVAGGSVEGGGGHVAGGSVAAVAGVHPERVLAGAHPGRGPVLTGRLLSCRPAGAGWDAEVRACGEAVWCRLPEWPGEAGAEFRFTLIDPPRFGPDGAALPRPDQVRV